MEIYRRFEKSNLRPWLDQHKLMPGDEWESTIPKTIQTARFFLVLLSSRSVNKRGYIQKEIALALDAAERLPAGDVFVIPARIEACDVPDRLTKWHWIDLFKRGGLNTLEKSIIARLGNSYQSPPAARREKPISEKEIDDLLYSMCERTGKVYYRQEAPNRHVLSNQHFLIYLRKRPQFIGSKNAPALSDLTNIQIERVVPAASRYRQLANRVRSTNLNTSEPDAVGLHAHSKIMYVSKDYWSLLSLLYPRADIYLMDENQPICFEQDGALVALVMGLRIDAS